MPRYRARAPLYIQRLIQAGEEFDSDLIPGRNWEPLDDEARAAVEQYRQKNGAVLSIVEKVDPLPARAAAVDIPDDWKDGTAAMRRGLAKRLGAQSTVTADDANTYIKAELDRRSARLTAA
jgi:hypothetical protein